ncbi:MAG: hypothetical protein EOO43_12265 [Flavobacterium sp.]|nr:MAG: hypothetical protein EOO43_12265 [Flavobacterium sp.]
MNKPVLCTQSVPYNFNSGDYPKFGEIYSIRDVVVVNGIIVGYLLSEFSATFGSSAETYFPKTSFAVVYKSLLNEADFAIRKLIEPLGLTML